MLDGASALSASDAIGRWYQVIERARSALSTVNETGARERDFLYEGNAVSKSRLPAISIDGVGFFVLRDGSRESYARSGHFHFTPAGALVDEDGRAVLAYGSDANSPAPLVVARNGADTRATSGYRVEEDGSVIAVFNRVDAKTSMQSSKSTTLGRLCLAIFPAPSRLTPSRGGTLFATPTAGKAFYTAAGGVNAGRVRHGVAELDARAAQRQLHQLWMLAGRAALDVALAATADGFNRIALNLVK